MNAQKNVIWQPLMADGGMMIAAMANAAESKSTVGVAPMATLVAAVVRAGSVRGDGLVTVFIRHTSASLIIQENADRAVQNDLEAFLARLVPEGDPLWTHTAEGPDDMPAHVKSALTATSPQK